MKKKDEMKKLWNKIAERIIKAICTGLTSLLIISCGSTKVLVDKPQQGTSTTITVTTNNPISTNTNPTIDLNQK